MTINVHRHETNGVFHSHCYGFVQHAHLPGSTCIFAECRSYDEHEFHTSTEEDANA